MQTEDGGWKLYRFIYNNSIYNLSISLQTQPKDEKIFEKHCFNLTYSCLILRENRGKIKVSQSLNADIVCTSSFCFLLLDFFFFLQSSLLSKKKNTMMLCQCLDWDDLKLHHPIPLILLQTSTYFKLLGVKKKHLLHHLYLL